MTCYFPISVKCTVGTVYKSATKTCDDCPIGSYRDTLDTDCVLCETGKTTETAGSTSHRHCIGTKTVSTVTAVLIVTAVSTVIAQSHKFCNSLNCHNNVIGLSKQFQLSQHYDSTVITLSTVSVIGLSTVTAVLTITTMLSQQYHSNISCHTTVITANCHCNNCHCRVTPPSL